MSRALPTANPIRQPGIDYGISRRRSGGQFRIDISVPGTAIERGEKGKIVGEALIEAADRYDPDYFTVRDWNCNRSG